MRCTEMKFGALFSLTLTEDISQPTEGVGVFLSSYFLPLPSPGSLGGVNTFLSLFCFPILASTFIRHLQERELSVTKGCQSSRVKEET